MSTKHTFDPYKAIVYFDLCFEQYDHEEDVSAAEQGNADAAARLAKVLAHDPLDFGHALNLQEIAAMNEVEAWLDAALPGRGVSNEGHDRYDNLVMKVGVNTLEEAKALADLVARHTGGGDDCCYLDTAYFCVQAFRLYPADVNLGFIPLIDIDDVIKNGELQ